MSIVGTVFYFGIEEISINFVLRVPSAWWCSESGLLIPMCFKTELILNEQNRQIIFQIRHDGLGQDGAAAHYGL